MTKGRVTITEDMVSRYFQLNQMAKEIEKEMRQLKEQFNRYFDQTIGQQQKGELLFDGYKLQRQTRISENYISDKTVQKLEELGLIDCIKVEKHPDKEKIDAAIKLGLLAQDVLADCKHIKRSHAIYVRKV